jgi:hypothetical protein
MKKILFPIIASLIILATGYILGDEIWFLNIKDTYFVTTYRNTAIFIVMLLWLFILVTFVIRKIRTHSQK